MKETILNKLNVDYPLKTDYQIAFLKHVIQSLEREGCEEIHDDIYEQLAVKLKEEKPDFSYKNFLLQADDSSTFTIKESNSFIRDGTTGLKLWPASMALAEFILQNETLFNGKSILELGSGATGFVGMVLVKACRPEKVYLSDCHDSVIETLIENVSLNLIKHKAKPLEKSLLVRHRLKVPNGPELGVLNLPWENVDKHVEELKVDVKPDVLLAADVVYDDTLFTDLIKCITTMFHYASPSLVFYLSQTVRNEETFKKFSDLLHQNNLKTYEERLGNVKTFNWDVNSVTKILRISRCQ